MKKLYGLFVIGFLIIALCAGLYAVDLNKHRAVYESVSAEKPLEGYWTSTDITSAYVNYYPTGVTYIIDFDTDTLKVPVLDFPLWKHWGVECSWFAIPTISDLIATDSMQIEVQVWSISASGDSLLYTSLIDSAIGSGWGVAGTDLYKSGRLIFTSDSSEYCWERFMIRIDGDRAVRSGAADSTQLKLVMSLPYSDQYLETDYYKNHQEGR